MRGLSAGLVVMLLALPAAAQPAATGGGTESVTVSGTRPRQVIEKFVEHFAAPTRMTGKLARWEDGICPVAVGLKPAFLTFITRRVRNVAAAAGAPVNDRADCKPNIEIVFTTTPQGLLDNVRKHDWAFLGYADNDAQRVALATVTRPIQAWYTTATRDLRGKAQVDSARMAGAGSEIQIPCKGCVSGYMNLTYAKSADSVTGSRLGDGKRSTLYHVIIAADPTRLLDHEIGAVADYISMLALTQLSSLDTCQTLPSIVNMLAVGCARRTDALTDNDAAYLRGLYHMSAGMMLRGQEDGIAYEMAQSPERK
jgi:hypothetical protein